MRSRVDTRREDNPRETVFPRELSASPFFMNYTLMRTYGARRAIDQGGKRK